MGTAGIRILTPDNVHMPEAFRCFALAHWNKQAEDVKPHEEEYESIFPQEIHTGIMGRSAPRIEGQIPITGGRRF